MLVGYSNGGRTFWLHSSSSFGFYLPIFHHYPPDHPLFPHYLQRNSEFALRLIYEPDPPPIAGIGVHCTTLPEQENNTIIMQPSANRYADICPIMVAVTSLYPISNSFELKCHLCLFLSLVAYL